jgi:hypothetical protein
VRGGDDVSEELSEAEVADLKEEAFARPQVVWPGETVRRLLATLDRANERCAAAEAIVELADEFLTALNVLGADAEGAENRLADAIEARLYATDPESLSDSAHKRDYDGL